MPAARTTKRLVRVALEAAQEAGFDVAGFEVGPGGTVRILAPDAVKRVASSPESGEEDAWDRAMSGEASA